MWNLHYLNKICNQNDKFLEHKKHVNKLLSAKSFIDNKAPYKPSFLRNKNKTQEEIIKKVKVNYENTNLLEKLQSIEKRHSNYHPKKILVKECPAFRQTNYIRNHKMTRIGSDNEKMYYRLKSARPTYSSKGFSDEYKQAIYYETLHRNDIINPCMYFETPERFQRNLFQGIRKELNENRRSRPMTSA